MENLQGMKAAELKEMAKGLQIKNWWTLKKEELITAIEAATQPEPIPVEIELPVLTAMEFQLMAQLTQDNFWEEGLESILWTDIFLDETYTEGAKKGRGVLSSLGQKGLLDLYSTKEKDYGAGITDSTISLTDLGKLWMTQFVEGKLEAPKAEAKPKKEKKSKKEEVKTEEVNGEDIITLKELISEAGLKGTKARRLLRGSEIERPYKRWEWHKELHKDIINKVRELLNK